MIYTRYGSQIEIVGKLLDVEGLVRMVRCRRNDGSTIDAFPWDLKADKGMAELLVAISHAPQLNDTGP